MEWMEEPCLSGVRMFRAFSFRHTVGDSGVKGKPTATTRIFMAVCKYATAVAKVVRPVGLGEHLHHLDKWAPISGKAV